MSGDFRTRNVDAKRIKLVNTPTISGGPTSQQNLKTGNQLCWFERLGNVVVRPQFQGDYLVSRLAPPA